MIQEIKLERRRNYPFYMVFAYPPTGPVLYTGDLLSIRDYCQDMPTHHAWITSYRSGERQSLAKVMLLGLNVYRAYRYDKVEGLCLFRSNRIHGAKYFCGRPTFVLLRKKLGEEQLIRRYRKLPNVYLRELKEYDEKTLGQA